MRKMGYIDKKGMTASDIVINRKNVDLITIDKHDTIGQALKLMNENNYSQIPVTSDDRIVGSIYENLVYNYVLKNPTAKDDKVESIMQEALPFIDITTPLEELSQMVSGDRMAVLVKDFKAGRTFIITKSDIAEALLK
jgi:cystathionine beta-synthase